MEKLDYNLLFRLFLNLNPGDPVWHTTTFAKHHDRVLNEELMAKFLELHLLPLRSSHCSFQSNSLAIAPPPPGLGVP